MSEVSGNLLEIFVSVQGEGIHLGERHLFVRMFGCNLRCSYCDTPLGDEPPKEFPVDLPGIARRLANPVPAHVLAALIVEHLPKGISCISFTGGEPLHQPDFLRALASGLKSLAKSVLPRFFLETNGALPSVLESVHPLFDVIAMDIKLPSVSKCEPLWDAHRRFLSIAPAKTFVKVVVGRGMADSDFTKAVDIVASVDAGVTFVIQPVWPLEVSSSRLIQLQEKALSRLSDVRIIVQQHEILGLR
jgi:organic radical activating enzyme